MKSLWSRVVLLTLLGCTSLPLLAQREGGSHRARRLASGVCAKAQMMSARVLGGGGGPQGGADNPWGEHSRLGFESDDVGEENDMLAATSLVTLGREYTTVVTLIDSFSATGDWSFQASACNKVRNNIFKTSEAKRLLFVPGPSGQLAPFEFDGLIGDQQQILNALGC